MSQSSSQDPVNEAGASRQPLVSEFAGDPEMAELIQFFVTRLPQKVGALQQALAESNHGNLTSLAHQLKGSAGGYGFPSITLQAANVEQQAQSHADLDTLTRGVQELVALCERAASGQ